MGRSDSKGSVGFQGWVWTRAWYWLDSLERRVFMRVMILGLRELGGFNGSDLGLGRMCVINFETLWLGGCLYL